MTTPDLPNIAPAEAPVESLYDEGWASKMQDAIPAAEPCTDSAPVTWEDLAMQTLKLQIQEHRNTASRI